MRIISKEGFKVLLDNFPEGYAVDGLGATLKNKNKIKVWLSRQNSNIGYIIKTKEIKTEVILFNFFVIDKDTIIVFDTEERVKELLKEELRFKVEHFYFKDKLGSVYVIPLEENNFFVWTQDHYFGVVRDCDSTEDAVKRIYPNVEIAQRYEIYPKEFFD